MGAQPEKKGILEHAVSKDGFKANHDVKLAPMVLHWEFEVIAHVDRVPYEIYTEYPRWRILSLRNSLIWDNEIYLNHLKVMICKFNSTNEKAKVGADALSKKPLHGLISMFII